MRRPRLLTLLLGVRRSCRHLLQLHHITLHRTRHAELRLLLMLLLLLLLLARDVRAVGVLSLVHALLLCILRTVIPLALEGSGSRTRERSYLCADGVERSGEVVALSMTCLSLRPLNVTMALWSLWTMSLALALLLYRVSRWSTRFLRRRVRHGEEREREWVLLLLLHVLDLVRRRRSLRDMRLILRLPRHAHWLYSNPGTGNILSPPSSCTKPSSATATTHPPRTHPLVIFIFLLPRERIRPPLFLPALIFIVGFVLCSERDEVGRARGREQGWESRAGARAPFVDFAAESVGLGAECR